MGRHIYYLSVEQLVDVILWGFIAQYLVTVSTLFIRLSVATFLIRIFGFNSRWRHGLILIVIFIIVTNIMTLVFAPTGCRPIQKSWNPALDGTCWSQAQRKAFVTYQGSKFIHQVPNRVSADQCDPSCWDIERLGFGVAADCLLVEIAAPPTKEIRGVLTHGHGNIVSSSPSTKSFTHRSFKHGSLPTCTHALDRELQVARCLL